MLCWLVGILLVTVQKANGVYAWPFIVDVVQGFSLIKVAMDDFLRSL
jgi:hypothetical protein